MRKRKENKRVVVDGIKKTFVMAKAALNFKLSYTLTLK